MADHPRVCLAILAAGASRRFGATDKLTANLHGKMLGLHLAQALSPADFAHAIIIAREADPICAPQWRDHGYRLLVNDRAAGGMASSVALAAQFAQQRAANGLIICLADMPFVPPSHIAALSIAGQQSGDQAVIATQDGAKKMPPAFFGSAHFGYLRRLQGDEGARTALQQADTVALDHGLTIDIDDAATLARLNQAQNNPDHRPS